MAIRRWADSSWWTAAVIAIAIAGCDGGGEDGPDGGEMSGSDSGSASMTDGGGSSGEDAGSTDVDAGPCTDGERRCNGATVEECTSGTWTASTSCAFACSAGECQLPPECTGSETRCMGNDLQQCSGGRFVTTETCVNGCSAGACITGPCTDGTRRCNGSDLEECSGGSFSLVESCTDGCMNEMCNECSGSDTRCVDADLQSCADGRFVTTETCTYGCNGGACNGAPECSGTESRCQGDDVQVCTDGRFVTTESCSAGCSGGSCIGCTSGDRRCSSANEVEICDGTGWQVERVCAGSCDSGACVGSVTCTPGEARCSGEVAEICNSTGSAFLYLATCPVSCSAGLCQGACAPGERRCNGNTLQECAEDGSGWTTAETCTVFCDAPTRTCALAGLEIATDTELEGDVVIDGDLVIRSGATVTSRTGDLTIYADNITIELGANIVVEPMGTEPVASTGSSRTYCSGVGGGYGGYVPESSGSATDAIIGPGGRGGTGGRESDYSPSQGGAGGLGGGTLRLLADTSITLEGTVRADGGVGSTGTNNGGGGGGGAGGGILVVAPTLNVTETAVLSTAGGAGGTGGCDSGGNGRQGEGGFVKTFSDDLGAISGTVDAQEHVSGMRPPLTITSSTHPDPTLIYNDGFDRFAVSWSRPFAVTGYFWTVDQTRTAVPTSGTGTFADTELASVDPDMLGAGTNFFHIVPINASSLPGMIQNYFVVQVNATPPNARSTSHANQALWYDSANPFFEWTLPHDASNYRGYYYVLDQYGDTVPDESDTWLDVSQQQILLAGIPSGVHMFHVISVDQQGYRTRTADHVRVQIGPDPGSGTIYGRVRDTSSVDLPGATVTVNRGLLRATHPDATTLDNGAYNMMGIPAGTWEVTVNREGYQPATQTVTVTDGGMTAADFNLTPE